MSNAWAIAGLFAAASCFSRSNGTARPTNGLIAFMAPADGGLRQIWVMDANGANQRALIPVGIPGTQVSWQPVSPR